MVQRFSEKLVISLTEWCNTRVKTPWRAFSGAKRQDVFRLRPVLCQLPLSILLVKSNFEISAEPISCPSCIRPCRPAICSLLLFSRLSPFHRYQNLLLPSKLILPSADKYIAGINGHNTEKYRLLSRHGWYTLGKRTALLYIIFVFFNQGGENQTRDKKKEEEC